jgi:hypothetical protein
MIGRIARLTSLLFVCAARLAVAQGLPSEPIALANGRVTVSGDVSAGYACQPTHETVCGPDSGFFNYTDYDHSALRLLRIDLTAAVKAGPHFTVLGEIRTENLDTVRPYALYLRIRPWTTRDFDIQIGRVPPTFGAFARRTYASDNPLVGYPLAYQYLTTIRPDAVPASADELLGRRGGGWLVKYSLGDPTPDHGVPLVSAFRWDTGVQAHGTIGMLSATAAVTSGTVSNPLFADDNHGRQVAGRVELRPAAGLVLGASLARGPFVSQTAVEAAAQAAVEAAAQIPVGDGHEFTQTAWGGDAEYSRDHYLLRLETIVSQWRTPILPSRPNLLALQMPLSALSVSTEGRYKLRPDVYVAARFDHLGFSDQTGVSGTLPWDAPVTRIEVGIGYSIERNLLLKASFQHDRRDGGRLPPAAHMLAAQLVFWF